MKINEFKEELEKLNINYNNDILLKLETYCDFLMEYNSHTNLTAIKTKEDIYIKHFLDSLFITKVIDFNNINNLIDIGTGAGFPGMVIKIFYPNIKLTLLDSNNKKTTFLNELSDKLDINDIKIVNDRIENFAISNLNSFDVVTSRAVAYIDIITNLGLPLVNKNGKLILMKGSFEEELEFLSKYKNELNVNKFSIEKYHLPKSNDNRNIIVIEKNTIDTKVLSYPQILKNHNKRNSSNK